MKKDNQEKTRELRRRAEAMLAPESDDMPDISTAEFSNVLHELHAHQIELEMQNEELRITQEELNKSRERFSGLFDYAPIGYLTVTDNGLILEANLTLAEMLGQERRFLLKRPLSDFIVDEDQDVFYRHRRNLLAAQERQAFELQMRKKDGERFWAGLDVVLVEDVDEGRVRIAVSDITGRKRAEDALQKAHAELERKVQERTYELTRVNNELQDEIRERRQAAKELRQSEEKFRLTFENAKDAIFWADPETGLISNCNRAAELLLEKKREEIIGLNQTMLHPPEKKAYYSDLFRRSTEDKGCLDKEAEIITKTGRTVPVRITASVTMVGEKPIIQGIFRDITERKQAEEALKNSSEKIKRFAYSVSHDLKNPSIAVHGLTRRLHTQYGKTLSGKGEYYCEQILRVSEQIVALVDKINVFISTREAPLTIEKIDLRESLRMVREEFSTTFTLRKITWVEPDQPLAIEVDRLALSRVLRNLIDNSLKYGGETLSEIKFGYRETDGFYILSVQDDGIGLQKDDSKTIFRMFTRHERTKGIDGLGLGLAIVKEIAEQHGGEVWAVPGPKKGVTIHVSFSKYLRKSILEK